jgi:hypothetical protein
MKVYQFPDGTGNDGVGTYAMLVTDLMEAPVVHTGEWQTMDTRKSPAHATHELEDVSLVWDRIPQNAGGVHNIIPSIDTAWAVEHFEERVSGHPMNPAPSHVRWPYAVRGNTDHMDATKFDHTYPERFWPKYAGVGNMPVPPVFEGNHHKGIRFDYGDLRDVVDLLTYAPLTRQAFLPVWFPEDTGATRGQRVPCTLGYHFMQRGGRLTMRYYMRSCDVYRHLSNDVFFAAALLTWMCNRVNEETSDYVVPLHFRPGGLVMHISSLHAFVADEKRIKERLTNVLHSR